MALRSFLISARALRLRPRWNLRPSRDGEPHNRARRSAWWRMQRRGQRQHALGAVGGASAAPRLCRGAAQQSPRRRQGCNTAAALAALPAGCAGNCRLRQPIAPRNQRWVEVPRLRNTSPPHISPPPYKQAAPRAGLPQGDGCSYHDQRCLRAIPASFPTAVAAAAACLAEQRKASRRGEQVAARQRARLAPAALAGGKELHQLIGGHVQQLVEVHTLRKSEGAAVRAGHRASVRAWRAPPLLLAVSRIWGAVGAPGGVMRGAGKRRPAHQPLLESRLPYGALNGVLGCSGTSMRRPEPSNAASTHPELVLAERPLLCPLVSHGEV